MTSRRAVRPYSSRVRAERAEKTRLAILAAARHVFLRRGFNATTVEAIAAAARVAVPTVYVAFGSKDRILSAVVADAGSDADIRALATRAVSAADPEARLRGAAKVMRLILEREGELLDLLLRAGSDEPALAEAWRQMHENRRVTLTRALQPLSDGRRLARGIDLVRAVDTVWALSSPELYRLLVRERGWTAAAFERWLADASVTLLLHGST
jgi:AcrR family transcriptional regulator